MKKTPKTSKHREASFLLLHGTLEFEGIAQGTVQVLFFR